MEAFEKLVSLLNYPMFVVTTSAGHSELARLFGETGDTTDKFEQCRWAPGPHGLPILDDAAGLFAGAVLGRFDLGDHVGLLLEPDTGHAPDRFDQLVTFADVRDLDPGHEDMTG